MTSSGLKENGKEKCKLQMLLLEMNVNDDQTMVSIGINPSFPCCWMTSEGIPNVFPKNSMQLIYNCVQKTQVP